MSASLSVVLAALSLVEMTGCDSGGTGAEGAGGSSAATGGGGAADGAGNSAGGNGSGAATQAGGGGVGPGTCSGDTQAGADVDDVVHFVAGATVSTLAGSATPGLQNGQGAAAHFDDPVNVLDAPGGGVFVADFNNGGIRKSSAVGMVSTWAVGPPLARPFGMTRYANSGLLVGTDFDENGLDAGPGGGALWRVSDSGETELLVAKVGRPRGMAALDGGAFVISDQYGEVLRRLDAGGSISLLAGVQDCADFADGSGASARFNQPYGMGVLANGDLVVADLGNHRLRRVTSAGVVTTLAGDGTPDMVDGPIETARFYWPKSIAIDADDNIYVSDVGNHRVRRVSAAGEVETIAGDGAAGFADGAGASARFFGQEGIALSADGKTLFVADGSNGEAEPYHRVRSIALP